MVEKIAAGNWKMNGSMESLNQLSLMDQVATQADCTTVICPPAAYLGLAATIGDAIKYGGQDCHAQESGAHTGDTAAAMLSDLGAQFVILGHSERRADHGETDAGIAAKLSAAQAAGLRPILCIGETLEEREAGNTLAIVSSQLSGSMAGADLAGLVVAYEPVWAIGTGKTATPDLIDEVHTALHDQLVADHGTAGADVPLLYGGSVKAANAKEIFAVPHVNGALVGGASLKAEDFNPIIQALSQA